MKSQAEILSGLRNQLDTIPDKKEKVTHILYFVLNYGDSFGNEIIELLEEGAQLSKEINFTAGEIICDLNLLFFGGMTQGQAYKRRIPGIEEINAQVEKLKGIDEWYPLGLNLLAFFHWFRGEYEKAFTIIFEATKIQGTGSMHSLAWNYFGLAVFYFDTKDYENAKISYQNSFELFDKDNVPYGRARTANGLASVAIMQGKPDEALPLLEFAINIYRDTSHYSGLSRAINDLGLLEKTKNNYNRAIELFKESIVLRTEIRHFQGLITSYSELGETYLLAKDNKSALEQFNAGMELALKVKTQQKQMRLHKLFYETYKELKDTESALENFEKYYEIKSKLLSDEATNNIKKIQTKFEKEKSEQEAEIERLKNVELKKANFIIEQKNKDILDSIKYAMRIQQSLMPNEIYIERTLKRLKEK